MAWAAVRHCPSYTDALPAAAHIVELVIQENRAADLANAEAPGRAGRRPAPAVFNLPVSPGPINNYLTRLVRYLGCAPATWVNAFILVDRFARDYALQDQNVHLVLAGAVMTAIMLTNDDLDDFGDYARVLGLPPRHLKSLVLHFLCAIDFELAIPTRLYREVDAALKDHTLQHRLS
eukprot:TRINITY_DN8530_c0_g1_i1.p1 TRINITY_DN8530_c0_g1~~TRINITY_DN8530_c0_g1_i1.p1  ORF type:complete len:198 (+),score=61.25 TRINITY_DN8530_c0_g1_i1:64-594(+)